MPTPDSSPAAVQTTAVPHDGSTARLRTTAAADTLDSRSSSGAPWTSRAGRPAAVAARPQPAGQPAHTAGGSAPSPSVRATTTGTATAGTSCPTCHPPGQDGEVAGDHGLPVAARLLEAPAVPRRPVASGQRTAGPP